MKIFMHVSSLTTLFLLFLMTGCADCPPVPNMNREWQTHAPAQGKYSVSMPGTPHQTKHEATAASGKLQYTVEMADLPAKQMLFVLTYCDYPNDRDFANQKVAQQILEAILTANNQVRKGSIDKKTPLSLGKHHGLECEVLLPERNMRSLVRGYLVGNRFFELVVDWPDATEQPPEEALKFLDSFQLQE
jgi:hypothetical protein